MSKLKMSLLATCLVVAACASKPSGPPPGDPREACRTPQCKERVEREMEQIATRNTRRVVREIENYVWRKARGY